MSMLRVTLPHVLAGFLLVPTLAACGAGDEVARDEVARDEPVATAGSTPSQDVEATEPTSGPDVGFGPSDYSYTLEVACYCPFAAVPVRVRVEDDEVVEAVFEGSGGRGGAKVGDLAPEFFALTIDDVIAEADTARGEGAHEVEVTWPERSDYPTEVYIDRLEAAVDEEIGYRLSDVKVDGEGIGG